MVTTIVFNFLQCLASAYACWRGGAPERVASCILLVAAIATLLAWRFAEATYAGVNWPVLWIDLWLLVGLTTVALFADRYWPLWLTALHLVAITSHAARAFDPGILPIAYWWIVNKAAYPMLAVLIVGTGRYASRRRQGSADFGWSFQRRRSGERALEGVGEDRYT